MELRTADFHVTLNDPDLWRDIKGYEGLYKISYNGIVYSYQSDKYLRPGLGGVGYLTVALSAPGIPARTHNIHRLVAEAFIENPEGKRCVNHIYGYKLNNHKDLLEWATSKENNNHAVRTGLRKTKCTPEVIRAIVAEHVKADPEHGARALARKFGLDKSTVHEILNQYKYLKN
jgi:hypothetical protein